MLEIRADALADYFESQLPSIGVPPDRLVEMKERISVLANPASGRRKSVEASQWLWENLVPICLLRIHSNTRGFQELCTYFHKFAEYERLLFALDDTYRDHVIHSIWVMLLGLFLRGKLPLQLSLNKYHNLLRPENTDVPSLMEEVATKAAEYEQSLWCLIALTHDLETWPKSPTWTEDRRGVCVI